MTKRNLVLEYRKKFEKNFPTFLFMSRPEEMEKEIMKCLEENKSFEPDEELQELLNNPEVKF